MHDDAGPRRRPAFSPWAWVLLAPFLLLTPYAGYDYSETPQEQLVGLGIAVVVHLLLGLAFFAAATVEVRIRPLGLRIAWVTAGLAVISMLRPLAISWLQDLLGAPGVTTPFGMRFMMNFALLGGTVLIVGAWLRASDRSRWTHERLRQVLRRRSADIQTAQVATDRLVEEFGETVARPVLEALEGARVRPFDAAKQAERLRRVAHDVVRPLSHRVFSIELPAVPVHDAATTAIERVALQRGTRLPERVVAAPAWLPALVFIVITLPLVPTGYDPLGTAARAGLAALVGLGGNALLRLVRIRRNWAALVVLALGYAVVGIGVAAAFLAQAPGLLPPTLPGISIGEPLWVAVPLGYLLVGVVIALGYSLRLDARASERSLDQALRFADRWAADARARYEATADDVARLLHNLVQGEIVATSLQLRMGRVGEDAVDELIERVRRMLLEPAAERAAARSGEEVRDAANAAIVSWTRAMTITSESDPECWPWLGRHPDATALFLDANVEALTNAARHGAAPTADLRLERIPGGVRLLSRNPGRLAAGGSDGVGTRDLRRRGAIVELRQEDPQTVLLTVDILAEDEHEGRPENEPSVSA